MQVVYEGLDIDWILRGICIAFVGLLVLIYVFISRATSAVVKFALGETTQNELSTCVQSQLFIAVPTC